VIDESQPRLQPRVTQPNAQLALGVGFVLLAVAAYYAAQWHNVMAFVRAIDLPP